jgi:quinol monooxygenase YgiN
MSHVRLSGQLVCKTEEEVGAVRLSLPHHIALTRAEPGCISFVVTQTGDPMIWSVEELFENQRAFELHQARVACSAWGRATVGLERRYSIQGLPRSTGGPGPFSAETEGSELTTALIKPEQTAPSSTVVVASTLSATDSIGVASSDPRASLSRADSWQERGSRRGEHRLSASAREGGIPTGG